MSRENEIPADLESKKRGCKVEITDIAISKVPFVKYKEIPAEHYEILQELAKTVLELAKTENDGNETAITYSLESIEIAQSEKNEKYIAVSYGDEHSVDPLNNTLSYHLMMTAQGCVVIILHNHPNLSKISLQDVGYLFGYASLKMIVAITNLGSIHYIVKTNNYNRIEAIKLYKTAVDMTQKAVNLKEKLKACDYFLNRCHKAGLFFASH